MDAEVSSGCDVLLIGFEDWENLGLRSIAAFLAKHGVRARVHPIRESREQILAVARRENPRIIGFSLVFQRMLPDFADLIGYLRENGIGAHFTMGGHFPSIEPQSTLELIPGLDTVVRGEGEETVLDLIACLDQPESWAQVPGLVYRQDGQVKMNPPRPLIRDLDCLPFPVRSGPPKTHRGLGICSILTSRGCYYDCSFCSIQTFYSDSPGPRRRARSPANAAAEMEQLYYERGIRLFIFHDDDLFMRGRVQRKWIDQFVEELKERKLADRILWRMSCRVDDVDPELLRKLMTVGLINVYIGIESGNDQGLATCNKHISVQDISMAVGTLRDIGLPFEFGFMLLNPDSTFDTLREDIDFLQEIGKDGQAVVDFTKMMPLAGTPIARRLANEGRLTGTFAAPNYTYLDPRLGFFEVFLSEAFHDRNFATFGLAEQLRLAKFDTEVLRRFFPDRCNPESFRESVQQIVRKSNEVAVEKMSMAVNFMRGRSEQEIVDGWHFVQWLVREAKDEERRLHNEIDRLITSTEP